jgi:hypothetical protein
MRDWEVWDHAERNKGKISINFRGARSSIGATGQPKGWRSWKRLDEAQ